MTECGGLRDPGPTTESRRNGSYYGDLALSDWECTVQARSTHKSFEYRCGIRMSMWLKMDKAACKKNK